MQELAADHTVLAGDIGGTHARFGCLSQDNNGLWQVAHFSKVKCADYPSFEAALTAYVNTLDVVPIQAAFAAAGPVLKGRITLTNTDWVIDAAQISAAYNFSQCGLYNDFTGMTRSVTALKPQDFLEIRSGLAKQQAPILVAGPGTGFGLGYLVPVTHHGAPNRGAPVRWQVIATEGGHVAYSAQIPLEFEMLQILQGRYGFVSLEHVSSGKNLPAIHQALCEIHGQDYIPLSPDAIRDNSAAGDALCRDICQIRAAAVMGAIGDLALSGGAQGGIVLAGGVSERMIDYFRAPEAMARFLERGHARGYLEDIPMRLLKSAQAPLIGAALLLRDARPQ